MNLTRLQPRLVEKVWGRRELPEPFSTAGRDAAQPIGEIIFDAPEGEQPPLLLKYLFTSDKLSVQVHPDDEAARARGLPHGKDEAWIILDAEPRASIGIGLRARVTPEELRAAAVDGSIESLLCWRSVRAGDAFYSPAGTIHAIGAGVSLIEVQQNCDTTYRLYDYGRPRELHLDDAVEVARPAPGPPASTPRVLDEGRTLLVSGAAMTVERLSGRGTGSLIAENGPLWLMPVADGASLDGVRLEPGGAWIARGGELALGPEAALLLAYEGAPRRRVWQ